MLLAALLALAVITVTLTTQIVTRYFLGTSVGPTDEVAQAALVWMTFLGAAFLYRERGHIEVDVLVRMLPVRISAVLTALVHVAIIASLALIIDQIIQMRGLTQRSLYGQIQVSRFTLHHLPLLIASAAMIVFALEELVRQWRSVRTGEPSVAPPPLGGPTDDGGIA